MPSALPQRGCEERDGEMVRGELLRLRAALDEVKFGVVLLDKELRAEFINRAFRKMWRLPDAKADSKPAFVALMYHGRDIRAYDVPDGGIDAYVAERVAHVKAGNPAPRDLRLRNGEVLRFQCIVLPDGGRMLSYTYVTDIVRYSDELGVLRAALDNVDQGVILLDSQLNAQFINRAVRELWGVSDEQAARKPHYVELVNNSRFTKSYDVPDDQLDAFISQRLALVRAGDPRPVDLRLQDGHIIRAQCAVLPDGGRMLTYTDVTDLVRHAEQLELLATTDNLTGVYNARQFHVLAGAEWARFQRYHRPLSLLVFDIDRFKAVNERYGHQVGDSAIAHIGGLCRETKRSSDIVARTGGDEFAILLPETDLSRAEVLAERLRQAVHDQPPTIGGISVGLTISIGIAAATLSHSGVDALMKQAVEALYLAKSRGRNLVVCAAARPVTGYRTAAE